MSCEPAMITDVISVSPDKTVDDAMALLEKHGIRGVPVINNNNELVGLFTLRTLIQSLLPDVIVMEDQPRLKHLSLSLDNLHGSMEKVGGRLKTLRKVKIEEAMIDKPDVVQPDTPLREGMRLLHIYGSPIPVVESDDSKKLIGIITMQSVLKVLNEMKESH